MAYRPAEGDARKVSDKWSSNGDLRDRSLKYFSFLVVRRGVLEKEKLRGSSQQKNGATRLKYKGHHFDDLYPSFGRKAGLNSYK